MAKPVAEIHRQALQLPEAERAHLAADLLATLDPDVPSEGRSESEWIAEVERRARVATAGEPGLTWPEAKLQIQRGLPTR